ncbi:hypothetical protein DI53_3234 [Sphingobacterium deserti]|uniref:Uncharacterized protein n=2 Tax=Sphingobacterium deserti TaxID=1229276 RepID=A0A0B8SZ93_9SPHI|nr:hypothetical protein DI53_3234 [Sphingobacterium deserti]
MIKKILYFIIVGICLFVFLLYMFGPFGGTNAIRHYVVDGLYSVKYLKEITKGDLTEGSRSISRLAGLIFWIALILPIILLPIWKMSFRHRFTTTVVCFCILITILIVPKIIILLNS